MLDLTELASLPQTADAALACGAARYFSGIRCRAGHISPRRTRSKICIECERIAEGGVRSRPKGPPMPRECLGPLCRMKPKAKRIFTCIEPLSQRRVCDNCQSYINRIA